MMKENVYIQAVDMESTNTVENVSEGQSKSSVFSFSQIQFI